MMPSMLNTNMAGVSHHMPSHAGYAPDAMLDEISRQLAAANNSRRLSRGTGSQRIGNAMRIAKPGSANNSPRSAALSSRRRTLVGEGLQRPHLQPVDANYLPTPATEMCEPLYEPEKRPARPVSWHPSTHQMPQQQQQQYQQQVANIGYTFPSYNDADLLSSYQQYPPTPVVYSGYTSPSATFSPLSLPYSGANSQQYYSPASQSLSSQSQQQQLPTPAFQQNPSPLRSSASTISSSELPCLPAPRIPMSSTGQLDWDTFTSQGFDKYYAAPPTPEDFVAQPPAPLAKASEVAAAAMSTKVADDEDALSYQSDDESEGEILYGMGLYDLPDRNSGMDFHRSTVFSLLGGAGTIPESMGKGLKLESAWEPPASDDEEEEEDADGEGEE